MLLSPDHFCFQQQQSMSRCLDDRDCDDDDDEDDDRVGALTICADCEEWRHHPSTKQEPLLFLKWGAGSLFVFLIQLMIILIIMIKNTFSS